MASWIKRTFNKLLGRKTAEETPEKEPGKIRAIQGAPAPRYSASDDLLNPANPLSPLSPLNTVFNEATAGGSGDGHRHSGCDPTPTHHSTSSGHCAPDTSSTHHSTTSHDTSSSYTHHDTSSFTTHHDTSSFTHSSFDGGSFSHHSF